MLLSSFKDYTATIIWVNTRKGRSIGLELCTQCYPWLAATFNVLVIDPSASPSSPESNMNFKNPYSYRESLLQKVISYNKFYCLISIEKQFSLKCSDEYCNQVQFAVFCTGVISVSLPRIVSSRESSV